MSVQDTVRALVEPRVAALGLVTDEVAVTAAGQRRQVRITLERALPASTGPTTEALAPITLDEIADATREVDAVLEAEGVMGEAPWTLEVSSAGVSRPLTTTDQLRRNVTRLLEVTTTDGGTVAGRLTRIDDTTALLVEEATGRTPERRHELPLETFRSARVQVEFTRPGAAGAGDAAEDQPTADPQTPEKD